MVAVPLEGDAFTPPGTQSFNSRPLFPSEGWEQCHPHGELLEGCSYTETWTDAWLTNHVAQAVIAAVLVLGFWFLVSRNQKMVPGRLQFVGEWLYDFVRNGIARDVLGHEYRKFTPYLVALFTFILVNNLFGEFFVFMFPTFSKIGFPYALALCSWLLYNGAGIAKYGFGTYLRKQVLPEGTPIYLVWLLVPLEFLSNIVVRPVTLALRLFANLFAGHLVILVFVLGGTFLLEVKDNLFYNFTGGISILFSFAIFALEIFIGALQAYIFTVLTAQYVHSSIAEEH
ncbi:MAG: F0F1 ATP synthase subunit A [Propionibacteriaceae bacterium]|jgi:F-type H+-transporting ATPase subunit a|nr:F0F1 ATP synthase subunit A [Propionibacteriaceae bacterium]